MAGGNLSDEKIFQELLAKNKEVEQRKQENKSVMSTLTPEEKVLSMAIMKIIKQDDALIQSLGMAMKSNEMKSSEVIKELSKNKNIINALKPQLHDIQKENSVQRKSSTSVLGTLGDIVKAVILLFSNRKSSQDVTLNKQEASKTKGNTPIAIGNIENGKITATTITATVIANSLKEMQKK